MSGKKRITINSDEYQRLRQYEEQLRAVQTDLPDALRRAWLDSAADLRRRLEPMERRQRAFEHTVEQVHSDVRKIERETGQRLEHQWRDMRDALESTSRRQQEETRRLIAEQERCLTDLIDKEHRARELHIGNLQRQIDHIVADQHRLDEMAVSWIESAGTLREFIAQHYRHEQFVPGELERLGRGLQRATQNASQGASQAALIGAQETYQDLSDLRLELEKREREWQMWRTAALQSAREILEITRQNRQCRALDIEGQDAGLDIDVNWWTEGKLGSLEQEINALLARVSDSSSISTAELRSIASDQVPALQKRLQDTVLEARMAVIASQERINVADLVVQILEEKGFAFQGGTYEGEDMRNGYWAKTRHLDGGEVVVLVTPKDGQPGASELQIHSYDEDQLSEYQLTQRAKELASDLRARGINVMGAPMGTGAHADPALREEQNVRGSKRVRSLASDK